MLSLGSLLIVLAVIALSVRSQLQASKRFMPVSAASSAAGVASSPFDTNNPSQAVSQYQHELEKAMKAAERHTADQAASAGDDGTR